MEAAIAQIEWLLASGCLPSQVMAALQIAIVSVEGRDACAPMQLSHGDLHLDNILIDDADGSVVIYDFDVVGRAPGAQAAELGILWHRLLREQASGREPFAIDADRILAQLALGYHRVAPLALDPAALIEAAAAESTRKLGASLERMRRDDTSAPWSRIAAHHVAFILEYQMMQQLQR